jgi:hypothetical protein
MSQEYNVGTALELNITEKELKIEWVDKWSLARIKVRLKIFLISHFILFNIENFSIT